MIQTIVRYMQNKLDAETKSNKSVANKKGDCHNTLPS